MTIIFALLFIIAVVISASLLVILIISVRGQDKSGKLLSDFDHVAAEFGIIISRQEVMGNRIIGFDYVHNNLLYLTGQRNKNYLYLIDLNDIHSCTVKKEYGPGTDFKQTGNRKTEVTKIALHLDYKNGLRSVVLPFFEKGIDPLSEMPARATKAREWQSLLSRVWKINGYRADQDKKIQKRA